MSREDVVSAYLNGGMSRRTFIRRLSTLGVSAGAAITYAYALKPDAAAAAGVCPAYDSQVLPVVTTGAASAVSPTGATLEGAVDANLYSTVCWFEFGPTASYGDTSKVVEGGTAADPGPISVAITGLAPATTYHYRAVAQNVAGRTQGLDATFTTAPAPSAPTALAGGVTPVLGLEVLFVTRTALLGRRQLGLLVTTNEAASGKVEATFRVPARRRSKGRPASPARDVSLGSVAFFLAGPGAQKVTLSLPASAVAALRGLKAPVVTVVANGADAAGNKAAPVTAVARF